MGGEYEQLYYRWNLGGKAMYFIEIFQAFTGRLPEIDDLIANTAGFLIGYLTAQGFLELFDEKNLYCQ